MFTIRQNGDMWELLDASGVVLSTHTTYDTALGIIAAQLAEGDATTGDGLLPEAWTSTTGIAFREQPDPERSFLECEWSFRDPNVYPLPLMLQTATEIGHFGAVLAGFMDVVVEGETPSGSGRFYDTEAGRQFRDLLLGGRRFGVSVDPGELDVEFVCTEQDDDGWCIAGHHNFLAYQIIGLTGTPFPAFQNATIELSGNAVAAPADDTEDDTPDDEGDDDTETMESMARRPVAASGGVLAAPVRPPAAWFQEAEPEMGDPRLVEQADGSMACPLYIGDDGQVYGNLARNGQCHIGYPQGPDVCVAPPADNIGYAGFMVGETWCEDGERIPTGALITGMDHPALTLSATEARDAYAHNGVAWADVVVTPGQWGPWVCGALRPNVSEIQLRVLRGSALSGDWRELLDHPGTVELIAGLAVNVPGFPIARQAIAAAGAMAPAAPAMRVRTRAGQVVAITAAGIVSPCPECARRSRAAVIAAAGGGELGATLAAMHETLALVERRTRHLNGPAAEALRHRIGRR